MRHALLNAWEKNLRRHADARAVISASDGVTVTFRELEARAASWLAIHASAPNQLRGRAVVFAVPNGLAWLEIFLGLLKAGALAVPVDATEPPPAQQALAASLRAGFLWDGTQLRALPRARRYRDPALCLLKLTSGTTGQPRALAFTAAQMLADARQITGTMGIRPRDLNYALIPLGHAYGLGNITIPLLAHGVPLVCGTSWLPHAIAADFQKWSPTVFPGVPALWRALAASDVSLPSLRLAISAGAALPPEVAQAFAARFGQRLHNLYGASETGGIAYDRTGRAGLVGEIGRPLRGVTLTPLSQNRLLVSSAAVFTHGHRRRAGQLGAWLVPDRVQLNARGAIVALQRHGPTVKIAGRRVNLIELTRRLQRIPGVREAWVGLVSGSGAEPTLGAVLATALGAGEIRAALQADTAPWKIPKKINLVAALPLTARGKPDPRALQALISPQAVTPATPKSVASISKSKGARQISACK